MKKNNGFTLLEVLITVVILSIGLLGLAGLQATGMKFNHSAYLRSQATILGYDMIDRMRANKAQASGTMSYTIDMTETTSTTSNCETDTSTSPYTAPDSCSPSQIATFDLNRWKSALAAKLPTGDGSIEVDDSSPGRIYIVTVQWDDSRGQETVKQLRIRAELRIF